tara:strand:- start:28 stop:219 length:192 start_codon:yes stop_codon:yes gene_type:complete
MMHLLYFKTHWSADEAQTVLTFLDELKTLIEQTYGEEIAALHRARRSSAAEWGVPNSDNQPPF